MQFSEEEVDIIKEILEEAPDLLNGLEDKVLTLETSTSKEVINEVFRVFHSLKGLAGFGNIEPIVRVAHALESALKKVQEGHLQLTSELIDLLLDGADFAKMVLGKISEALQKYSQGFLRVDLENLGTDDLVKSVEKLQTESEKQQPSSANKTTPEVVLPEGFQEEALTDFISELEENIAKAESSLLEHESKADQALLNDVMRAFHSIKGGARLLLSLPMSEEVANCASYIEKISHNLEDLFQRATKEGAEFDSDLAFDGIDVLRNIGSCLAKGKSLNASEIERFVSRLLSESTSLKASAQQIPDEIFGSFEAFVNIATQLLEYIDFLVEDPSQDKSQIHRVADPLKTGLKMIGHEDKLQLVDQIVKSAESSDIESLKKYQAQFVEWLKSREIAALKASQAGVVKESSRSVQMVSRSVRVDRDKLDRMMNLVGELLTLKNSTKFLTAKVEEEAPSLKLEMRGLTAKFERLTRDFQSVVMAMRMTPIGELFNRYKRTTRDLAKSLEKKVSLVTEGEEVELDRSVIEVLVDPLTHLVRNAIDHGIEPPSERNQKGKPEEGTVILRAYYKGSFAFVEIEDDGKGIDAQAVRAKIVERGLVPPDEAIELSDEEALQFIFEPGFSTAKVVSDISGRGVGMDVVKASVESVGGKVFVSTKIDHGTKITMRIPLSLLMIKGLMVRIASEKFIIPLDSVQETLKVPLNKIHKHREVAFAEIRGEITPILFTEEILLERNVELSENRFSFGLVPMAVIHSEDGVFAIVVDEFVEEGDYLVKNISEDLKVLGIFSGATIMGDGSVVLILNPYELVK